MESEEWRQEAVRMHREDPELSTAAIAEKLGKPLKTVKNLLANARKKEAVRQESTVGKGYVAAKGPVKEVAAESCYRIAPISGKGLGLVATRKICRGELVVEEEPVLKVRGGYMAPRQLQEQFEQLEASVQDEIMALHDKNGENKTLLGVFGTNALPQGVGSLDSALFLVISRANHSCVSNCYHGWVDGHERLYADADIESGEEICTNYTQWHCPTAQRQQELEAKFGFVCQCPACTEAPALRKKHDALRTKIGELDATIPELYASPAKALARVEQVLSLYEQLGRPTPYAAELRHCYDAFQLALSSRNIPAAKRWIQRAHAAKVITDGANASDTLRFKRFVEDPMSRLRDGPTV